MFIPVLFAFACRPRRLDRLNRLPNYHEHQIDCANLRKTGNHILFWDSLFDQNCMGYLRIAFKSSWRKKFRIVLKALANVATGFCQNVTTIRYGARPGHSGCVVFGNETRARHYTHGTTEQSKIMEQDKTMEQSNTMKINPTSILGRVALVAVLCANLVAASPLYAAGEEATHEARILELEKTVSELKPLLEQQACAADKTCSDVEPMKEAVVHQQDHPSAIGKTKISVGGFAKLDAIVSDYSKAPTRGVGEDFFIPPSINTTGSPSDPNLNLHAKETRFWLKSNTPTGRGDISTYFEIDFMASAQGNERTVNAYSPRLRHTYIKTNRWTLGQTWSTFGDTASVPDYLDDLGPVGVANGRQAQIRYTLPTEDGNWMFALENPETTLTPFAGGARIAADDSALPDAVVRRNWTGEWGAFSVAGMLRQLKIDSAGYDDSEFGSAIALSGRF